MEKLDPIEVIAAAAEGVDLREVSDIGAGECVYHPHFAKCVIGILGSHRTVGVENLVDITMKAQQIVEYLPVCTALPVAHGIRLAIGVVDESQNHIAVLFPHNSAILRNVAMLRAVYYFGGTNAADVVGVGKSIGTCLQAHKLTTILPRQVCAACAVVPIGGVALSAVPEYAARYGVAGLSFCCIEICSASRGDLRSNVWIAEINSLLRCDISACHLQ